MLENYKDILTPAELCEILRIGRNTVYKLLQSNEIPNKRIGDKKYIIPKLGVISYLNNCNCTSFA